MNYVMLRFRTLRYTLVCGELTMMTFKVGDKVSFVVDGEERNGTIGGSTPDEQFMVQDRSGPVHVLWPHELLRPKAPFFAVRGLIMTTSATHPGEVGEIVTLGKSASGKRYFKVRFRGDPNEEWFDEDQVFLADD